MNSSGPLSRSTLNFLVTFDQTEPSNPPHFASATQSINNDQNHMTLGRKLSRRNSPYSSILCKYSNRLCNKLLLELISVWLKNFSFLFPWESTVMCAFVSDEHFIDGRRSKAIFVCKAGKVFLIVKDRPTT